MDDANRERDTSAGFAARALLESLPFPCSLFGYLPLGWVFIEVSPPHGNELEGVVERGGSRLLRASSSSWSRWHLEHRRRKRPRPLGVAHDAMLACASLWAAVCGPDTAFGRVWWSVWPRDREMRVEGRRRSKMAEAAIVADKIEGLLLFVLEAAIDRILKKSARLPLSPQPLTPPRL